MTEEIKPDEDIFDEIDEDETEEGDEEVKEGDQEFIDKVNKETGKNFKSVEAITKSLKQMDKEFAEKGQIKKEVKSVVADGNEDITEELLLVKNPEAETVLDDVKAVADAKYNGNRVKAYREEAWLQEKAKIEMQKEENIKKIKSPSSDVRHVEPSVKVTDEDKRIADKYFGGDIARYLKVKSK
jgi:hypothetical protein